MKKVITHSGPFHADDVFAVATLQLVFGSNEIEVTRTRDESIINSGDIVLDVGGVYEPDRQRFDHHQVGAPVRENGVPYAAFGLIWKYYGENLCGSAEIVASVEKSLVMPVDASDNGFSLFNLTVPNLKPVTLSDLIGMFNPANGSSAEIDAAFLAITALARDVISRSIEHAKLKAGLKQIAANIYNSAENKQLLIFEVPISRTVLTDYPDVQMMVSPDNPVSSSNWLATAIPVASGSFELRVRFPEEWGGLAGEELAKISGIPDAVFCHRAGFLFVSKTQEGALAAANKVLGR